MTIDPFEIGDNYSDQVQVKLTDVIKTASPVLIAKVVRKALESLVLAERVARNKGIEITELDKRALMERDYPDVQAEVDRAVGQFIGSIVSREGA